MPEMPKSSFKALWGTALRIFGFLGPLRFRYIVGGLAASLEMASIMLLPFLYEQLVAVVSSGGDSDEIYTVLWLLASLLLLAPPICWGIYSQNKAAVFATGELRKAVFAHIQQLPVSSTMDMKTGEYVTLMTNDVERTGNALRGFAVTSLFRFALMFSYSAVLLFTRHWPMAILIIFFSALSFWASLTLTPRVRAYDRQAQEYAADTASFLIETIKGLPIVRVFLLKRRFTERYRILCQGIRQRRVRYRAFNGIVDGLISLFHFSAQPVGLLFGVYLVVRGQIDIGSLVFLAGLAGVMADSIRSLSSFISFIQNGLVSGLRVFQLLDTPAEEERMTLMQPDLQAQAAVELDHVTFRYRNGQPVLNEFSAQVGRGEVVALVGPSGCGKTTVIKLLQDFYSVESGSITLFGRPMRELSRTDVRNLSAYVPQDSALFDGTIADNIGLGQPGSSRAAIEDAAKKACIHDYILSLPQGYDTAVGERGSQVSGGQRQRIAIARALLKDAPLLLLDEATSALDSESEAMMLQALKALNEGRTTIVIAHRLSTIQHADRILVIDKGTVVESGSHQSLLDDRGIYHALFLKGAEQGA